MIRKLIIPSQNAVVIGFTLMYTSGEYLNLSGYFPSFCLMDL